MQIQSYFPEAFRLINNPRFVAMDGGFLDQLSGESYPLQGLVMDADSWVVVGWLLNWLDLSHSRTGVALRVPLIVIEGPLESGKSWLLNELVKIIGCKGIGFHGPVIPPTFAKLDAVAKCPEYPLWIFDHPELLPKRTAKQKAVFKERLWAFQGFLGAELHKTRKGRFYVLRVVAVVTGCAVDLPADLEQRAVRIRLRERAGPAAAAE